MKTSLSDQDIKRAAAALDPALAALAKRFPGDSPDRQPVHTVYGGAQLFKSDTCVRLGGLALRDFALALFVGLLTGAYVVVAASAIWHRLPVSTLLVMLSLPVFIWVLRASELGATGQVRALSMIDLKTARLHMTFGSLLVAGLFLARYVH